MPGKRRAIPLAALALLLPACGRTLTPPAPTPTVTIELRPAALNTPTGQPATAQAPLATDPPPTFTPTPIPSSYVIEPGDTLMDIAVLFGVTVDTLLLANPHVRPLLLQTGQQLTIPANGDQMETGMLLASPTPLPLPVAGFGLYETPAGGLWALGEIVNNTPGPVENVRVAVTLYDADGSLFATRDSWVAPKMIPAGQSAPFAVLFSSAPAGPVRHRISLLTGEPLVQPDEWYPHLVIKDQQGGPAGPVHRVTGTVLNDGNQPAEAVTLLVTVYNSQGQVTGFSQETLVATLPAQSEVRFDIRLSPGGPGTNHHTVAVSGRRSTATD